MIRQRLPLLGLAVVLALPVGCSKDTKSKRDPSGTVTKAGDWSTFDLRAGDCLLPPPDLKGDVENLPVVPCAENHTQEVFGLVKHPADAFPGMGELANFADGKCVGELQTSLGVSPSDGFFVSYLLPSFDSWNKKDDRTVVCVLVFPKEDNHKGSVVADRKGAATPDSTTTTAAG